MAQVCRGDMGTGQKREAHVYVAAPYPAHMATVNDVVIHCSMLGDVAKSESLINITLTHDEALRLISQLALRISAQELVKQ